MVLYHKVVALVSTNKPKIKPVAKFDLMSVWVTFKHPDDVANCECGSRASYLSLQHHHILLSLASSQLCEMLLKLFEKLLRVDVLRKGILWLLSCSVAALKVSNLMTGQTGGKKNQHTVDNITKFSLSPSLLICIEFDDNYLFRENRKIEVGLVHVRGQRCSGLKKGFRLEQRERIVI